MPRPRSSVHRQPAGDVESSPVIDAEASDARNTVASATSSGATSRRNGVAFVAPSYTASYEVPAARACSRLTVVDAGTLDDSRRDEVYAHAGRPELHGKRAHQPDEGQTCWPHTACAPTSGRLPVVDPITTTAPRPRRTIAGSSARQTRNVPVTLTRSVSSHSSGVTFHSSAVGPAMPLLQTIASSSPTSAVTLCASASTAVARPAPRRRPCARTPPGRTRRVPAPPRSARRFPARRRAGRGRPRRARRARAGAG